MNSARLHLDYFRNPDTLALGRDLIGKYLFTHFNGITTGGMIVETESYLGADDRACHAYGYKRTQRNKTLYQAGGVSYVYLCYGIHALFNIVSHVAGEPHAILVRAIRPEVGIPTMLKRRKAGKLHAKLTSGPGTLTQALGICTLHDNTSLLGPHIWLEDHGYSPEILITPRIGIEYAKEDALKPWRFVGLV